MTYTLVMTPYRLQKILCHWGYNVIFVQSAIGLVSLSLVGLGFQLDKTGNSMCHIHHLEVRTTLVEVIY